MANPSKNSPVAEQVKDLMTSDASPVALRCAKVALGALDTAGGILGWQNPESSAIVVVRIAIDRTTKSTAACTADFGTAVDATTSSDNLLDGVDVGAAAAAEDNIEDKGTNGKSRQRLDGKGGATGYITGSKASGAAAGLVGNAYIFYYDV